MDESDKDRDRGPPEDNGMEFIEASGKRNRDYLKNPSPTAQQVTTATASKKATKKARKKQQLASAIDNEKSLMGFFPSNSSAPTLASKEDGNVHIQMENNKNTYIYSKHNKGPYTAWLTKIKPDNQSMNRLRIAGILMEKGFQYEDVKFNGSNCVEIVCNTPEAANKIIQATTLTEYNLQAYVPTFRQQRKGIIKRIPVEYSDERIANSIKSDANIIGIRRLSRKNNTPTGDKDKWIPSETVLVTFEGQILPYNLKFHKCIIPVEPYVQKPMQCFNCFKFGHKATSCKSKAICIMCGWEKHEGTPCANQLSCANCQKGLKRVNS